jgi:hypothetical protein
MIPNGQEQDTRFLCLLDKLEEDSQIVAGRAGHDSGKGTLEFVRF